MHLSLSALAAATLLSAAALAQTPGVSQPLVYGCDRVCHSQNDPVTSFVQRSLPNEYAHAVQLTNAATVNGFSFYFQTVSLPEATIQAAVYREDAATPGQPDPNPIANATIKVGMTLDWYTAVLDTPVQVAANELFFISADTRDVRPPDDGSGATPPAPSFWRRPPFGGTAWSQTGIINSAIYRIHCGGRGGVINHVSNAPTINNQLDMDVIGAEAGVPCFPVFGGAITPLDLTPLGAPGCSILPTPQVVGPPAITDGMGDGTFSFMLPNDAALVGAQIYTQFMCGSNGNALGFEASNSVELTVGG